MAAPPIPTKCSPRPARARRPRAETLATSYFWRPFPFPGEARSATRAAGCPCGVGLTATPWGLLPAATVAGLLGASAPRAPTSYCETDIVEIVLTERLLKP